jgi:hypothetical protein
MTTIATGIATLGVIALDCREPQALAQFYSALSGAPVLRSDDDWVQLAGQGGVALAFQRAPGHVPDLDAAEAQVLAIGARKHEHQPGTSFRVYLDPAGHPFCLCLASSTE